MAVPVLSNPSTASINTSGAHVITWSHTTEADKALYVVVFGSCESGFAGDEDFEITATFGGTELTRKFSWFSAARNDIMRVWVFSLVNPAAGVDTLVVTSHNVATTEPYTAIAFNVANAPENGDVILPGAYYEFDPVATMTKTNLGWADGGLHCSFFWGGDTFTTTGVTLTGGTPFTSGTGVLMNTQSTADTEYSYTASCSPDHKAGLFSFTIPSGDVQLSGGVCQPILTGWAQATTSFNSSGPTSTLEVGLPYSNFNDSFDSSGSQSTIIPYACTVRSLKVRTSIALLAGQTLRCEFVRGGYNGSTGDEGTAFYNPTGVYVDLVGTAQHVDLDDIAVSCYPYEQLGLRFTYISGAGSLAAINITAGLLIESATSNNQMYGGGSLTFTGGAIDEEIHIGVLHPWSGVWSTFDDSQKSITGVDCVVEELVATYQTDVPMEKYQYYLAIDGVVQASSEATLIPNTMNRSYARSRFSIAVPAHSFLSAVAVLRDAAGSELRQAVTIKLRPVTPGDIMLSGHSVYTGFSTFVTSANSDKDSWTTTLANESTLAQMFPPLSFVGEPIHVTGFFLNVDGVPPGGVNPKFNQQLRKDLAATSMPDLVIQGAALTAETGGDVTFDETNTIGFSWTGSGFPNAERQFWTIPGTIALPTNNTIIVIKQTVPDGLPQVFDFTTTGGLTPSTFQLTDGQMQTFASLVAGTYGITEIGIDGYSTIYSVSDGSPHGAIVIADGETVTVIVTNTLLFGTSGCPGDDFPVGTVIARTGCPSDSFPTE